MSAAPKTTIRTLRERKVRKEHIAMLTCYDCPTAQLMSEAGIDTILVGDTYAEVVLGHSSTLPAAMDSLVEVTQAVRRGAPGAFLIGDMPFLSYQASDVEAIHNAGRFLTEGGCDAVKVEVDQDLIGTVSALSRASIPVIAHLGLRPQSIHQIGGYRAQGKDAKSASKIIDSAHAMVQAGACMLLLEAVPAELGKLITQRTDVPVIGCASGPYCDGTVVVLHDMLGYQAGHPPSSVKRYANLHDILVGAFQSYKQDVERGEFPTLEHCIRMPADELERLQQSL